MYQSKGGRGVIVMHHGSSRGRPPMTPPSVLSRYRQSPSGWTVRSSSGIDMKGPRTGSSLCATYAEAGRPSRSNVTAPVVGMPLTAAAAAEYWPWLSSARAFPILARLSDPSAAMASSNKTNSSDASGDESPKVVKTTETTYHVHRLHLASGTHRSLYFKRLFDIESASSEAPAQTEVRELRSRTTILEDNRNQPEEATYDDVFPMFLDMLYDQRDVDQEGYISQFIHGSSIYKLNMRKMVTLRNLFDYFDVADLKARMTQRIQECMVLQTSRARIGEAAYYSKELMCDAYWQSQKHHDVPFDPAIAHVVPRKLRVALAAWPEPFALRKTGYWCGAYQLANPSCRRLPASSGDSSPLIT